MDQAGCVCGREQEVKIIQIQHSCMKFSEYVKLKIGNKHCLLICPCVCCAFWLAEIFLLSFHMLCNKMNSLTFFFNNTDSFLVLSSLIYCWVRKLLGKDCFKALCSLVLAPSSRQLQIIKQPQPQKTKPRLQLQKIKDHINGKILPRNASLVPN